MFLTIIIENVIIPVDNEAVKAFMREWQFLFNIQNSIFIHINMLYELIAL